MKITFALCALLLACGLTLNAADKADKPKATPEEMFKKLDKNGDGKLDKAEYVGKREGDAKTKAEAAFDKMQKDGFVSKEAFLAGAPKKKADK